MPKVTKAIIWHYKTWHIWKKWYDSNYIYLIRNFFMTSQSTKNQNTHISNWDNKCTDNKPIDIFTDSKNKKITEILRQMAIKAWDELFWKRQG